MVALFVALTFMVFMILDISTHCSQSKEKKRTITLCRNNDARHRIMLPGCARVGRQS
jgi:hypothetical protein